MSLLLDALKKAAKEKQVADADGGDTNSEVSDGLDHDAFEDSIKANPESSERDQSSLVDAQDMNAAAASGSASLGEDEVSPDGIGATPLTVSDEALQILVHKANKQYRSSQVIVWGSVLFATFLIMFTGGVYFYYSMTDDVASIENRHKLVMRSVVDTQLSKSVTEKIEQQNALAEAEKKSLNSTINQLKQTETPLQPSIKIDNKKLVINKKNKPDPVDVLATRAWNAYIAEDYETAASIYKQVLGREKNNRDALLGIAAIAVKQGDIESARSMYGELVRLNPRDPIAVAAMSNLQNTTTSERDESKLKLMIRQSDNPSHLYFALGNIYSQQSRWPEAQQSYFRAWQSDNKNADYAFNLAVSLDQMGKQKEAVKFYKESLINAESGNTQFSIEAAESRLQQLNDGH